MKKVPLFEVSSVFFGPFLKLFSLSDGMKRITSSSSSPNVTGNRDPINNVNFSSGEQTTKKVYGVSRVVGHRDHDFAESTSSSSVSTSILTQELLRKVFYSLEFFYRPLFSMPISD